MSERAPLIRIEAPHFVAGVIVGERAAPVISYMRGWTVTQILGYCERKGWSARLFVHDARPATPPQSRSLP
jgi:hypothetical protein